MKYLLILFALNLNASSFCESKDDLEKYYVFYVNNLYMYETFKESDEAVLYLSKANYFGLVYSYCKEKLR